MQVYASEGRGNEWEPGPRNVRGMYSEAVRKVQRSLRMLGMPSGLYSVMPLRARTTG